MRNVDFTFADGYLVTFLKIISLIYYSCWLYGNFAIVSAIVPIAMILAFNTVFFVLIVVNHSKLIKKRDKYLHTLEKDKKFIKREIILILTCFINTGN